MSRFSKKSKKWFLIFCFAASYLIFQVWAVSPWLKFGFNITDSVNGYFFVVVKGVVPEKGDLGAFMPPRNGYYDKTWFVKYLTGVPGDVVEVKDRAFYINGSFIGLAKEKSLSGDSLGASQAGVIPEHKYFFSTSHVDSFDSRYALLGLIDEDRLFGTAYRIF